MGNDTELKSLFGIVFQHGIYFFDGWRSPTLHADPNGPTPIAAPSGHRVHRGCPGAASSGGTLAPHPHVLRLTPIDPCAQENMHVPIVVT